MKTLYPYLVLIFICTSSFNSFGQTFTPGSNLNIDVITSANVEVSWTQGTNVLYYEIQFTLDGMPLSVTTLPASASAHSHFDPPNGMDGIDEILVELKSIGLGDDGNTITIPIKALVTVDEIYSYEEFSRFCDKSIAGPKGSAVLRDTENEVYWSVPCICQTVEYVEDYLTPHTYHGSHYAEYFTIVTQPTFPISVLIEHLKPLLQEQECVSNLEDYRGESGKKEDDSQVLIEQSEDIYFYYEGTNIIIANVPVAEQSSFQVYVYDLSGKLLPIHVSFESNGLVLDKTDLSKGVYFVKILNGSQLLHTEKVLVD